MNNNSINLYQKRMAFFIGMHIPVFAAICIFLKTDIVAPMVLQGILTLMAFMAVNLNKKSEHVSYDLSSICIALTPAVFVYAFEGHTWQIDAHMYFFAAMAMLIAFKSIRAMIIGTLTVALHHIILNFALPYALYPEGTDFSRVILHAVILLVETGVLILIIRDINNSDQHLESESDKAKEALEEAEKQKDLTDKAKAEAEDIRIKSMIKLADDFDQAIGELISSLSSSSTTLESTAVTMKDIVSQSEDSSTLVANLLSSAVQNLNTVTTAMEEITSASQEISQQVSSIKNKSINTNKEAESANDEVNNLNTLADNIGEVVVAIRDIAEQTNLLALNATIEAARAGESGKGFAVVADEVKKLASETANKTDDINNRVLEIQSASQQTVQAMGRIISETTNMEDSIVAVSAAVEEQTSTTAEIARGISQVSDSIDGVNETMKGVKESVDSTGSASQNVSSTSIEVSNLAQDLESSVNNMLNKIRSDS